MFILIHPLQKTHQRRAVERYIARLRYEADMLDQCLTQQSEATTRA